MPDGSLQLETSSSLCSLTKTLILKFQLFLYYIYIRRAGIAYLMGEEKDVLCVELM